MRIVGREHDAVVADHLGDVGQRSFFRLAGDVNRTVLHVVARFFLQIGERARAAGFVFIIQTVHHVGQPAAAGFEKSDFQFGKLFEHAVANNAGELNHQGERMFQRVHLSLVFKEIETETAAGCAVNSQRYAKSLGRCEDRPKIRMTEPFVQHRGRRQKRADHVEFVDGIT